MSNIGTYPFDPTGKMRSNYIPNEPHNITQMQDGSGFLFSPNASPFYGDSVVITNSSGIILTENVDYLLTHKWADASKAIGLDVFGSITMLSRNAVGLYRICYNTLGGDYVVNKPLILEDAFLQSYTAYIDIDWTTAPTSFPPSPHTLNANAIAQFPQLVEAIMYLSAAVRQKQDNVSVDSVDGLMPFYINTTLMPILQLIGSLNSTNTNFTKSLLEVSEKVNGFILPDNLQHYQFKLGNIVFKFGYYAFSSMNIPTTINFVGDPFNQPIFASLSISPVDPNGVVTQDTIHW